MGQELTKGLIRLKPVRWSQVGLMGPGITSKGARNMYPSQAFGSWKYMQKATIPPIDSPNRNDGNPLFSSVLHTDLK